MQELNGTARISWTDCC